MSIELTDKEVAFLTAVAIGYNPRYTYEEISDNVPPRISCYADLIEKRLVIDLESEDMPDKLKDAGVLAIRYIPGDGYILSVTPLGRYALLVHSLNRVA